MKQVTVYTADHCPYCMRAKNLLKSKGIVYQEVNISQDPKKREELEEKTGWMTVPMIFIGEEFIGGADKLQEMAASGELEQKLK